jgi:hypothetical protein
VVSVVVCLLSGAVVAASSSLPALAVPGNPGGPGVPGVLYTEDFEQGSGVTTLPAYTSAPGITYTADPSWLNVADCNGFVLSAADTIRPGGYCADDDAEWTAVLAKTQALGLLNSPPDGPTNRALSSNTSGAGPGQSILFATAGQLPVPTAQGRFVTFSVDAAATACGTTDPLLRFYLRNAANVEVPADHVADAVVLRDERQQVTDCLGSLTDVQRECIQLAYYDGLTYVQVSEHLTANLATIKSRMRDAIRGLRKCLGLA